MPGETKDGAELRVVVAGVPRSLREPRPDGRWLTDAHVQTIESVSSRVRLTHLGRTAMEADRERRWSPQVLAIEVGADPWYEMEIPSACFARLISPRLRWIQLASSGIGHVLDTGLVPDGVMLTNAAGVHADALAESAVGAILFRAKRLEERLSNQRSGRWVALPCDELRGSSLVVVGTGRIGTATARRARALGLHTVGVRRRVRAQRDPEHRDAFDQVVGADQLRRVLGNCRYVVLACPLTPETEGLFGAEAFACMPPGGYLVNVARGRIVQERALLDAVARGHLAGAFLDAHAEEPLPAEHPYWRTPGIVITPHDAHASPYIGDNFVALLARNLAAYVSGRPLENQVDRLRGY